MVQVTITRHHRRAPWISFRGRAAVIASGRARSGVPNENPMTWLFVISVSCVVGAALVPIVASIVHAARGARR